MLPDFPSKIQRKCALRFPLKIKEDVCFILIQKYKEMTALFSFKNPKKCLPDFSSKIQSRCLLDFDSQIQRINCLFPLKIHQNDCFAFLQNTNERFFQDKNVFIISLIIIQKVKLKIHISFPEITNLGYQKLESFDIGYISDRVDSYKTG